MASAWLTKQQKEPCTCDYAQSERQNVRNKQMIMILLMYEQQFAKTKFESSGSSCIDLSTIVRESSLFVLYELSNCKFPLRSFIVNRVGQLLNACETFYARATRNGTALCITTGLV